MKKIKLRGGAVTLVDDDVFVWASKRKWRNEKGYAKSGGAYNSVYLHRLIMNPPAGMQVDHINRNSLDNRTKNLRIVTESQNKFNRSAYTGLRQNKSGYKGVYLIKGTKRYAAEIRHNYKKYWLGCFLNKKDAARAYNEASVRLHGEYGCLNKI